MRRTIGIPGNDGRASVGGDRERYRSGESAEAAAIRRNSGCLVRCLAWSMSGQIQTARRTARQNIEPPATHRRTRSACPTRYTNRAANGCSRQTKPTACPDQTLSSDTRWAKFRTPNLEFYSAENIGHEPINARLKSTMRGHATLRLDIPRNAPGGLWRAAICPDGDADRADRVRALSGCALDTVACQPWRRASGKRGAGRIRRAELARLCDRTCRTRNPRYLYELLADYPRRGGKMLRSSLCIAMARINGRTGRRMRSPRRCRSS